MDWNSAMKEERAALGRLVALLFSLAALAESAHDRIPIVRGFVIWVLRRAETVARDFVLGEDADGLLPADVHGSCPAEAMRLALSFRELAGELERQTRLAFVVEGCAIHAAPAQFSMCRLLDVERMLHLAPPSAFAKIARPSPCGPHPPDTS